MSDTSLGVRTSRALRILCSALAGCGGGVTNGDDSPVDVAGGWPSYTLVAAAQGWTCASIATGQLQITQSDETVGGTYGPITLGCRGPSGEVITKDIGPGQITKGRITGNNISFDFAGTGWKHTGTVVPDVSGRAAQMTGGVSGTVVLGAPWGTISFTNNSWYAIR